MVQFCIEDGEIDDFSEEARQIVYYTQAIAHISKCNSTACRCKDLDLSKAQQKNITSEFLRELMKQEMLVILNQLLKKAGADDRVRL